MNITREKLAPLTKETLEMMVVDLAIAFIQADVKIKTVLKLIDEEEWDSNFREILIIELKR